MKRESVLIEDAKVVFRNFEGKEGPYNRAGDRNFCILLDEPLAGELADDGWNVKGLRSREEGEPDQPYIQVSVGFKVRPPKMVLIGNISRNRTELDEDMCSMIDWVDIEKVDVIFRPYEWHVNQKSGIKAYLQTIFVTICEDYLELKYNTLDDMAATAGKVIEDQ
jgi:hypothetical protein